MGKTKLLLFADYKTVHKKKKKREREITIINKQNESKGFGERWQHRKLLNSLLTNTPNLHLHID